MSCVVARVMWSDYAAEHMLTGHGVTTGQADEALDDPGAIWADPDPGSVTGQGARAVGWCASRQQLVTVILLHAAAGWVGVNGWPTKSGRDRTAYRRANDDQQH